MTDREGHIARQNDGLWFGRSLQPQKDRLKRGGDPRFDSAVRSAPTTALSFAVAIIARADAAPRASVHTTNANATVVAFLTGGDLPIPTRVTLEKCAGALVVELRRTEGVTEHSPEEVMDPARHDAAKALVANCRASRRAIAFHTTRTPAQCRQSNPHDCEADDW